MLSVHGPFSAHFGRSRHEFGPILGVPGMDLSHFRPILDVPGMNLGLFGSILGVAGMGFRPILGVAGMDLGHFRPILGVLAWILAHFGGIPAWFWAVWAHFGVPGMAGQRGQMALGVRGQLRPFSAHFGGPGHGRSERSDDFGGLNIRTRVIFRGFLGVPDMDLGHFRPILGVRYEILDIGNRLNTSIRYQI